MASPVRGDFAEVDLNRISAGHSTESGMVEEKAAIVKEHGKEVMWIGERISGLAARYKTGRNERSELAPTGTNGR